MATRKSADDLYDEALTAGIQLIDDMRFRGVRSERAAKRLDKVLDKFEKAWAKRIQEEK